MTDVHVVCWLCRICGDEARERAHGLLLAGDRAAGARDGRAGGRRDQQARRAGGEAVQRARQVRVLWWLCQAPSTRCLRFWCGRACVVQVRGLARRRLAGRGRPRHGARGQDVPPRQRADTAAGAADRAVAGGPLASGLRDSRRRCKRRRQRRRRRRRRRWRTVFLLCPRRCRCCGRVRRPGAGRGSVHGAGTGPGRAGGAGALARLRSRVRRAHRRAEERRRPPDVRLPVARGRDGERAGPAVRGHAQGDRQLQRPVRHRERRKLPGVPRHAVRAPGRREGAGAQRWRGGDDGARGPRGGERLCRGDRDCPEPRHVWVHRLCVRRARPRVGRQAVRAGNDDALLRYTHQPNSPTHN